MVSASSALVARSSSLTRRSETSSGELYPEARTRARRSTASTSSPGGSRSNPVSACLSIEVQRIIESRLPTEQPMLEVRAEDVDDHPQLVEAPNARNDGPVADGTHMTERAISSKPSSTGRLYRQTRQKLTHYWLGIDNPPGWFERAVIVTARLIAKEGLSEDDAVKLLRTVCQGDPRRRSPLFKSFDQR